MADELLERFDPVTLEELDERAALLRRVDNKYAVEREAFGRLLERLRDDHQVLEIEGEEAFAYCTTYFDSPGLRCYVDHVEDRAPRFFRRITLAAREGSERLTCDLGVRLSNPDGEAAEMCDGMVLVETKSERGESPADRAMAELGLEPISLSKYRVGMSLVGGAERTAQPGADLFETSG